MSEEKVTAQDLAAFAAARVNLPSEVAAEKREQVNTLRKRLETKVNDEPGFSLVKMRHAGSVAKGTALRTVNDFDVAVYVKKGDAPVDDDQLVPWMADRLRDAYKGRIEPEQVQPDPHCATITFKGTGTVSTSCRSCTRAPTTTAATWSRRTPASGSSPACRCTLNSSAAVRSAAPTTGHRSSGS